MTEFAPSSARRGRGRIVSLTAGKVVEILLDPPLFRARRLGQGQDTATLQGLLFSAANKHDIQAEIEWAAGLAADLAEMSLGRRIDLRTPLEIGVFLIVEKGRQGNGFHHLQADKMLRVLAEHILGENRPVSEWTLPARQGSRGALIEMDDLAVAHPRADTFHSDAGPWLFQPQRPVRAPLPFEQDDFFAAGYAEHFLHKYKRAREPEMSERMVNVVRDALALRSLQEFIHQILPSRLEVDRKQVLLADIMAGYKGDAAGDMLVLPLKAEILRLQPALAARRRRGRGTIDLSLPLVASSGPRF